jgi:hypothetical protein
VNRVPPPNLRPSTGDASAGVVIGRIRKESARKDALLGVDDKIQEERQRIAEHLVRILREAEYSCEFGEDGPARALKPFN